MFISNYVLITFFLCVCENFEFFYWQVSPVCKELAGRETPSRAERTKLLPLFYWYISKQENKEVPNGVFGSTLLRNIQIRSTKITYLLWGTANQGREGCFVVSALTQIARASSRLRQEL